MASSGGYQPPARTPSGRP